MFTTESLLIALVIGNIFIIICTILSLKMVVYVYKKFWCLDAHLREVRNKVRELTDEIHELSSTIEEGGE